MPRVLTPQQKREKAFIVAMAAHAAELGLKHDTDVADHLGMTRQYFSRHKNAAFQKMDFEKAASMGRKMGMTGREWCAAAGIPYE